jgi:hypothetical protein
MESIMIPEIDVRNARVSQVIEFLVEQMIPFDSVRIKPQYRRGPSEIIDPSEIPPRDPELERRYAKLHAYCGEKPIELHLLNCNALTLLDLVTRSAGVVYRFKGEQLMILTPDGEVLVEAWNGEQ